MHRVNRTAFDKSKRQEWLSTKRYNTLILEKDEQLYRHVLNTLCNMSILWFPTINFTKCAKMAFYIQCNIFQLFQMSSSAWLSMVSSGCQ
jgi:hypothetical protein